MSKLELSAELLEALDRFSESESGHSEDGCRDAGRREADLEGIRADAELVKRCILGEVTAWEELYDQCQAPLLRTIEHILGAAHCDANLVDELAARVWYALVAEDGKLLARFDARRGARLGTFLRCVAKDVTARYFRSEGRRRRREWIAGKLWPNKCGAPDDQKAAMAGLVEILTPSEQEFLDQYLLSNDSIEKLSKKYSPTNRWKLASRIRQKVKEFFAADQ